MRLIAIIVLLGMILCVGNADAVEFKLGDFNITMNPPETVDHISYSSDTYSDQETNTATFKTPFLSYEVRILESFSTPVEEFKSIPVEGVYDSLSDIEMDSKPAVMIIANQFTTVEYVKDDKALVSLQFKETKGTDSSNSIAETIKSFKATRATQMVPLVTEPSVQTASRIAESYTPYNATIGPYTVSFDMGFSDYYTTEEPWKASESLSGDESYEFGSINVYNNRDHDDGIAIISIKRSDKDQKTLSPSESTDFFRDSFDTVATRTIDGTTGFVASQELNTGITIYMAHYQPTFDPNRLNVSILSNYPWDSGTLQLLKTIHVERTNKT